MFSLICSRIHIFGNKFCAEMHPDSRAIFYEANTYSKRKINDLLSTLRGFEKGQEIASLFEGTIVFYLNNISVKQSFV